MTTFIKTKTADILSFVGVSIDELTSSFPENSCMTENQQRILFSGEKLTVSFNSDESADATFGCKESIRNEQGRLQGVENHKKNVADNKLEKMAEKCRSRT